MLSLAVKICLSQEMRLLNSEIAYLCLGIMGKGYILRACAVVSLIKIAMRRKVLAKLPLGVTNAYAGYPGWIAVRGVAFSLRGTPFVPDKILTIVSPEGHHLENSSTDVVQEVRL